MSSLPEAMLQNDLFERLDNAYPGFLEAKQNPFLNNVKSVYSLDDE